MNAASVLGAYHLATKNDPLRSKAWHIWALANLDMIRNPHGIPTSAGELEPVLNRINHVVAAIQGNPLQFIFHSDWPNWNFKGFFRSLALMSQNKLPDILSLLTLWFRYGGQLEVTTAMNEGFKLLPCDVWLDVVPQVSQDIINGLPSLTES